MIANSFMKSKITYGLPLYLGSNQIIKRRLSTCLMRIARFVKGNNQFMISNHKICRSIEWNTPNQTILQESLITIHKLMTENSISTLNQEIRKPKSKRKKIFNLKHKPKCERMKRNTIYLGLKTYNLINEDLKIMNQKSFKKKIRRTWISEPPIET